MRSMYLAIPAVLLTIGSTVMLFVDGASWALGLAIGIIALVAVFLLKDVIDWKYYLRHPPELEKPVLNLLNRVPFYKQLTATGQIKFRHRLALFILAHQFRIQMPAGAEEDESMEAPEDLKALCSIPAIILLFNQEDYLITRVAQVVFYRHPFPSPLFKMLHHSEWNEEDNVLIFSIPHLLKGVTEPFIYFDLGMYEWLRVTGTIRRDLYTWEQFENDRKISQDQMMQAIGLPQPDLHAIRQVLDIHTSYLKEL